MSDTPTPTTPRPKAYSYIRFSSPEQMKGDSNRRQSAATRQYVLEHGLDLDEDLKFKDEGVSAFKGKHAKVGALSKFLEAVDQGKIRPGSYLILENLDRLSREDVHTAYLLLSSILDRGITVVTLQDRQKYTKEGVVRDFGQFMLSLLTMHRAHQESVVKSDRLSKAWEHKRQDAREKGKAMTSVCPKWLKLDTATGKYIPIPERVEVVKRIFRETLEGKGANALHRQLNAEGISSFGGKPNGWGDSYIKKILANEAVFGRLQPHTTKKIEGRRVPEGGYVDGYYPAIVDEETFYRAQTMRQERRIPGGRTVARFSNLFTGLVKCGVCGSTMAFDNKGRGPKGGTYLVCTAAKRKVGDCTRHAWRYPLAQAHILLNLHRLDYRDILPDIARQAQDEAQTLEQQLDALRAEQTATSTKLGNIAALLVDRPDSPTMLDTLDTLEKRQRELAADLAQVGSQLELARSRTLESEEVARESGEAFRAYIAAEEQGEPGQVYEMRRRLHQLLLRQVAGIRFIPALNDAPELHGVIEVAFAGTDRVQRIKVEKGQEKSKGYHVKGGEGEEVLHVIVPGAVWPPKDRILSGRALGHLFGAG